MNWLLPSLINHYIDLFKWCENYCDGFLNCVSKENKNVPNNLSDPVDMRWNTTNIIKTIIVLLLLLLLDEGSAKLAHNTVQQYHRGSSPVEISWLRERDSMGLFIYSTVIADIVMTTSDNPSQSTDDVGIVKITNLTTWFVRLLGGFVTIRELWNAFAYFHDSPRLNATSSQSSVWIYVYIGGEYTA